MFADEYRTKFYDLLLKIRIHDCSSFYKINSLGTHSEKMHIESCLWSWKIKPKATCDNVNFSHFHCVQWVIDNVENRRLNMELDLQSLLGSCAHLYSLVETPQPPPFQRIAFGLIYEGAMVSQHRRHLFVTPWWTSTYNRENKFQEEDFRVSSKAVNREDKRSRRYRGRHFAKFERSCRYRDR